MRLFIAAMPDTALVEALTQTLADLRATISGRYVRSDQFHVTLAFLGDVQSERVEELSQVLRGACHRHCSFQACLGSLGSFGRPSTATVWQGFDRQSTDHLTRLAASVREALDEAGFSYDRKAFKPHVTLMRAACISSGSIPAATEGRGIIDHVSLMRSELIRGRRPQYSELHTVWLSAPPVSENLSVSENLPVSENLRSCLDHPASLPE